MGNCAETCFGGPEDGDDLKLLTARHNQANEATSLLTTIKLSSTDWEAVPVVREPSSNEIMKAKGAKVDQRKAEKAAKREKRAEKVMKREKKAEKAVKREMKLKRNSNSEVTPDFLDNEGEVEKKTDPERTEQVPQTPQPVEVKPTENSEVSSNQASQASPIIEPKKNEDEKKSDIPPTTPSNEIINNKVDTTSGKKKGKNRIRKF